MTADQTETDPELAWLAALRGMGWRFQPLSDGHGTLVGIMGWRHSGEVTDTLYVFDRTDCRAIRMRAGTPPASADIVWSRTGDLTTCVEHLIGRHGQLPLTEAG